MCPLLPYFWHIISSDITNPLRISTAIRFAAAGQDGGSTDMLRLEQPTEKEEHPPRNAGGLNGEAHILETCCSKMPPEENFVKEKGGLVTTLITAPQKHIAI